MTDPTLSLGIDIGGTKAHGMVLDAADRILAQRVLPTRLAPEGVRRTVIEVAQELAADLGVAPAAFGSVGLGIPGLIDHNRGIVETAVNLDITHCDLAGLLVDDFATPVRVENDVKAAALGAALALGSAYRDLVYVNLGTGLAAAAISDGRLVRGLRNGAGEIGHFAIDPDGDPCVCGQRGCLETVLGGFYLTPRLAALDLQLGRLDTDPRPEASAERERIVTALATALTMVVIGYDSTAVALGGGIVTAAPWLRPAVTAELRRRAAGSGFLTGLGVAGRLVGLPSGFPVAAIGAALVGRSSVDVAVSSLEG